jgi:hypothetical protein
MDDCVYRGSFLAHFTIGSDSVGEVVIETERVSPAGEIPVQLMDGLVLRVDFARPDTLVGIDIDFTGPTDTQNFWTIPSRMIPMPTSLIGGGAVKDLLTLVGTGRDGEQRLGSPVQRGDENQWARGQAAALGEAVHLLDIANDPEELLGVRVVAAFESVRYSSQTWHDLIENEINRLAIEAIERIRVADSQDDSGLNDLDGDLKELMSVDRKIALLSAEVISEWKRPLPIELENFRTRVLKLLETRSLTTRGTRRDDVDHPQAVAGTGTLIRVERVSPGRLRAMWSGQPRGGYARVLNRKDQSILAVSPVFENDGVWSIEAVIPAHMDERDVLVSDTSEPFPIAASSQVEQVLVAFQLGKKATRLSMDQDIDRGQVAEAWEACMFAWQKLGDDRRAKEALVQTSYRRGSRRTPFAAYVRTLLLGHEFD